MSDYKNIYDSKNVPEGDALFQEDKTFAVRKPVGGRPSGNGDEDTIYLYGNPYSDGSEETLHVRQNGGMGQKSCPVLVRKKTGERICLHKKVFRIGRGAGKVDYCIPDNRMVSRVHADILTGPFACYLVDLDSKNHTRLNGRILTPNRKYELSDGDSILFGNEAFTLFR